MERGCVCWRSQHLVIFVGEVLIPCWRYYWMELKERERERLREREEGWVSNPRRQRMTIVD